MTKKRMSSTGSLIFGMMLDTLLNFWKTTKNI